MAEGRRQKLKGDSELERQMGENGKQRLKTERR
jgi:hypothetical protein